MPSSRDYQEARARPREMTKSARMSYSSNRFSGTRLAASFLFAAIGAAAVHLHILHEPAAAKVMGLEAYLAAALSGGWAAWSFLGLHVGNGIRATAIRSVLAGLIGVGAFLVVDGVKAAVAALRYLSFSDAMEMFVFILERAANDALILLASPAFPALLALVLVSGTVCEGLHWMWRRGIAES